MAAALPSRLMKVPAEVCLAVAECADTRPRDDRLRYRAGALCQDSPRSRPRQAASGSGKWQAGRGLELVDGGFERNNQQEMSQYPRFGRSLVFSGRATQAACAFQAFECEFDTPPQTIKFRNIIG